MINTLQQLEDYLVSAIRQGVEASKNKSKLKDFDFWKGADFSSLFDFGLVILVVKDLNRGGKSSWLPLYFCFH